MIQFNKGISGRRKTHHFGSISLPWQAPL